jgi:hypothetical protein
MPRDKANAAHDVLPRPRRAPTFLMEGTMRMRERVSDWLWQAKEEKGNTLACLLSIAMGALVIAAAFHWRDRYQFWSAVITGAVIVVCALGAWLRTPYLRFVNTAAGVWLFFSPILLPYQQRHLAVTQMWVALVVIVASFFPLFSVSADEGDILPPVPHHA